MFTSILPRTVAVIRVSRAAMACPHDRCYSDLATDGTVAVVVSPEEREGEWGAPVFTGRASL